VLTVADDGRGFDPTSTSDGNGLINLRERAGLLSGQLRLDSSHAHGTTITLTVPLGVKVKQHNRRLRPSRP
jgi:signal transduction histidine kinase